LALVHPRRTAESPLDPLVFLELGGDFGAQSQGVQQPIVLEPMVDERPLALCVQDPLSPHQAQVVRDKRLGEAGSVNDFRYGTSLMADDLDDSQAIGIGKRLEEQLEFGHVFHINTRSYKQLFI